ncbi:uncharacterized protein LOC112269363 [Brachypodium distachyon]|uniref:uncharacterized protein LOC112269363 n=1 Tax=Brachypodium distachyon TaxID=15368 RepID=UPI000D0D766A|nr:uncharacterized protein LOC112269363 [Brachypodium distachyon]|eukprot:XP_024311803.1 uncharacterized protein LOC112269363 [Brachypodium distachyon]
MVPAEASADAPGAAAATGLAPAAGANVAAEASAAPADEVAAEVPAGAPKAAVAAGLAAAAGADIATGEDAAGSPEEGAAAAAYTLDLRTIRSASLLSSSSSSTGTTSWDAIGWPASSSSEWREGQLVSDSLPVSSSTYFSRDLLSQANSLKDAAELQSKSLEKKLADLARESTEKLEAEKRLAQEASAPFSPRRPRRRRREPSDSKESLVPS